MGYFKKIASVKHAQDYYFEKDAIEAPDHYGENSEWQGKLANYLNLSGEVRQEDFGKVISGGFRDYDKKNARIGWDFTLAPPKSVSMALYLSDDEELKKAIRQADINAVKKAVSEMEGYAQYRVTENHETRTVTSGNLCVALYRHSTSRRVKGQNTVEDPQGHTHVVIANMTCRADGKVVALDNTRIVEHQSLFHTIYLSELAKGLKAIGVNLRYAEHDKKSSFEIEGIDSEIFSKRHNEIKALKEQLPHLSEEQISLMSRQAKRAPDKEEIVAEWKEQLPKGWDKELRELTPTAYTPDKDLEDKMFSRAIEHLSKQKIRFSKETITDQLLQENMYLGLASERAADIADSRLASLKVVHIQDKFHNTREFFTTKELAERYQYIIDRVNSRNTVAALCTAERAREGIKRYEEHIGFSLTKGQSDTVFKALTTTDNVMIIQGDAGTGKTTMVDALRWVLDYYKTDTRIEGVAKVGVAVDALKDSGHIEARTIDSHLQKPSSPDMLIVDECSMVSANTMYALMQSAPNTRLLLMGDVKQLPPPMEEGMVFKDIQENHRKDAEMTEMVRQRTHKTRTITKHLQSFLNCTDEKGLDKCLEYMKSQKAILSYSDEIQSRRSLINSYLISDNTTIITKRKATVKELNIAIRDELKKPGELEYTFRAREVAEESKSAREYKAGDIVYRKGAGEFTVTGIDEENNLVLCKDYRGKTRNFNPQEGETAIYRETEIQLRKDERIRFTKNNNHSQSNLKVTNGNIGTIKDISKSGDLTVAMNNGKNHTFNIKNYPFIEYAYASTLPKSQGATMRNVILYDNNDNLSVTDFNLAATRASHNFSVHTRNEKEFVKSIKQEREITSHEEILTSVTAKQAKQIEREERIIPAALPSAKRVHDRGAER